MLRLVFDTAALRRLLARSELEMLYSGMALPYPTLIPGLRSPFDQVKGIVYFGRMLDKIRLAAAGKLPEGWQAMRGTTVKGTLDGRCCTFLHIDYAALEVETLKGVSDEELLAWAFEWPSAERGGNRSVECVHDQTRLARCRDAALE